MEPAAEEKRGPSNMRLLLAKDVFPHKHDTFLNLSFGA